MGFYSRHIFPRLCDLLLDRPQVTKERQTLLSLARGDMLEIGLGTGLNLPHYPSDVRKFTTVEPSALMNRLAQRRIRQSGREVDQRIAHGEELPFDGGSFDSVVCTFTLCSVRDAPKTLSEAYRVLKPGGRLLLLEHGLSRDPAVQHWQHRLNWLQRLVADGCQLNRDIRALVIAGSFSQVGLDEAYLAGVPKTHGFLYRGSATK